VAKSETLSGLQDWYARQCDGDWEHQFGISIESLDNPGWPIRIDLHGTALAERASERAETHHTADDGLSAESRASSSGRRVVPAI
jgi:hypothetical protein